MSRNNRNRTNNGSNVTQGTNTMTEENKATETPKTGEELQQNEGGTTIIEGQDIAKQESTQDADKSSEDSPKENATDTKSTEESSNTESIEPAVESAKPVEDVTAKDQASVVSATPVAQDTTVTAPSETGSVQAALDAVSANGTKAEKNLMFALESYATVMAPGKPITGEEGSRRQYALLLALRAVIENAPEGEFKRLWNLVLAFANLHKDGVFAGQYINRFAESWHRDKDELSTLQRLVNLISVTADSEKRSSGLKSVDLTRTLEFGFTDSGRARLVGFYTS